MKSTRANASKSFPGTINVKLGTRGLVALTIEEARELTCRLIDAVYEADRLLVLAENLTRDSVSG